MPWSRPRLTARPAPLDAAAGTPAWEPGGKISLSLCQHAVMAHDTMPPPQPDTPLSGL